MPNPTLLADLAWRLASSPEDVATDALRLILGRSDAARQAVNSLIQQWSGAPDSAIARWKSQVVGPDDSRTDMEGYDPSNALRAISRTNSGPASRPTSHPHIFTNFLRMAYSHLSFRPCA